MWMRGLPFVTTVVEYKLAPLFLFRGFLFRGFFLSDFLLSDFPCHNVITSFRAFSEVLFCLLFNFQLLYTLINKKLSLTS